MMIIKPNLICGNVAGIVGDSLEISLFTKIIRNSSITHLPLSATAEIVYQQYICLCIKHLRVVGYFTHNYSELRTTFLCLTKTKF